MLAELSLVKTSAQVTPFKAGVRSQAPAASVKRGTGAVPSGSKMAAGGRKMRSWQ